MKPDKDGMYHLSFKMDGIDVANLEGIFRSAVIRDVHKLLDSNDIVTMKYYVEAIRYTEDLQNIVLGTDEHIISSIYEKYVEAIDLDVKS